MRDAAKGGVDWYGFKLSSSGLAFCRFVPSPRARASGETAVRDRRRKFAHEVAIMSAPPDSGQGALFSNCRMSLRSDSRVYKTSSIY